jgi:hypothetical protein
MDQLHALVNMPLKSYGPVPWSCKHATELLGSIKDEDFLDYTSYYFLQLLSFYSSAIKDTSHLGCDAASPGKRCTMLPHKTMGVANPGTQHHIPEDQKPTIIFLRRTVLHPLSYLPQ